MSEITPSPPSPDAPPERGALRDKFDAMLLDTSDVVNYDFPNNWGINDTEDALALSGVDDASLKDCIVDASASVWGGLVLVTRMHSNSIHPTKTTTMMRTTHPLPRTRPVETQSPRRRGIIKWRSTAVIDRAIRHRIPEATFVQLQRDSCQSKEVSDDARRMV